MIVLLHPRSTKPKNRRFPLSILSIASALEGKEEYTIVDGNLDPDPGETLERIAMQHTIEMLAVSVMPGPQMVSAIPLAKNFRRRHANVPIVWGGYFPSLYATATLNAPYVDFAVRGPGVDTFVELLSALRTTKSFAGIRGLSWKDSFGFHRHNADRPLGSPNDFPILPYHRLGAVEKYLLATFLGRRTAVHHASMGCAFRCRFCGVVPVFQGRQRAEPPEQTASVLADLERRYAIDAVQFYDNNFFLNESHTRDLAERLRPLKLHWWAEGRVDTFLKYSNATLQALRDSGAAMIFFGAESASDEVLAQMNKRITSQQTLELAGRIREYGIVPEFSFIFGSPNNPEGDTRENIRFIRKLKRINPEAEIVVQHYIPTPNPDGMFGGIDHKMRFPSTPDEWATERWLNFTIREDPQLPWLPRRTKRRIDNFELVINSRWPTVQDIHLPRWGRGLLKSLSGWRYTLGFYEYPLELSWAQKLVSLRKPRWESL